MRVVFFSLLEGFCCGFRVGGGGSGGGCLGVSPGHGGSGGGGSGGGSGLLVGHGIREVGC